MIDETYHMNSYNLTKYEIGSLTCMQMQEMIEDSRVLKFKSFIYQREQQNFF